MPAQESAVMNRDVTGNVKAKAPRRPAKKAKVDTSEIRAQIKTERESLKGLKSDLQGDKAALRSTLQEGKRDIATSAKHLKAVIASHAKVVKADEKQIVTSEKAVVKQQGVIDKLTAKLN